MGMGAVAGTQRSKRSKFSVLEDQGGGPDPEKAQPERSLAHMQVRPC